MNVQMMPVLGKTSSWLVYRAALVYIYDVSVLTSGHLVPSSLRHTEHGCRLDTQLGLSSLLNVYRAECPLSSPQFHGLH